ncbi:MAG: hypothetical protein JSR87_04650 [Proteobacteria bacterium]|nr:hypothetical protein [Pseudomonadota bacterium]
MPDLQARAYPLPPIAPPPSPGGTGVLLKPPALGGFLPALASPGNRITVAGPTPVPWPALSAQPLQAAGVVKPILPGAGGFMLGQWGGGGGTGAGSPALPPVQLAAAGNPPGGGAGGNGSQGGNGGAGGNGNGNAGGGNQGNGNTGGGNPGGGNPGGGNPGGGNPGGNPGGGNVGGNPGGSPPVTLGQANGLPILVPTGQGGPGNPGGPSVAAALPTVAPVPLPAAGLVLIGAIGALAGASRRRWG